MIQRIWNMLIARNKEYYRDKGTLLWSLIFPFIIILGFAFAFSGGSQDQYKAAVFTPHAQAMRTTKQADPFLNLKYVNYIPVTDLQQAIEKVRRHQVDILVDPAQTRY